MLLQPVTEREIMPEKTQKPRKTESSSSPQESAGNGGEPHQVAGGTHPPLTTKTGAIIAENKNSLRAGERGTTLLQEGQFLEKIQHFDHARIPERVLHARGFGAHGYFELTK